MWVKRIDARFLEGGKDSVSLEGLAADILDKAEEFELRNIRTSIPNSVRAGLEQSEGVYGA